MSSSPSEPPQLLQGKIALVTGAALGLGSGIARALGRAGARVCATDIDDPGLGEILADMRSDDSQVMTLHLDAGDAEAFQDTVGQVMDRWGRVDVLVHAGIYMPLLRFENTSYESWWRQLHISLGGLFNGCKAVWDIMKDQGGGHIIGIGSGSSFRGRIAESTYCTAKHGQEGFIKSVALEAAQYNIAINTIGPGKIIKPTNMTRAQAAQAPAELRATWTDPADLGRAYAWLASQPFGRFSGFRFDAGPIVDTIDAEGWDFEFTPEKTTPIPDDFRKRVEDQAQWGNETGR